MRRLLPILGLLLCAVGASGQTTTFNGVIKDLTSTPVPTGQVTFQLKPGIDTTISGSSRFVPATTFCDIHNPGVVSTSGTGTITVVVDTAQNWLVGDSLIFVGTPDATLNASSVASPYVITVRNSSTSFVFTQSGAHTNGAGGTVGGLYKSGGTGACAVMQNSAITPANTSYTVAIQAIFSPSSAFNAYAIGSGPVDISTVVPTPSQMPAYSFADTFSNQTIGGNKGFTGNDSHIGPETFGNLNTIRYVDGVKYALTNAGVTQAIADANAQGGGQVIISQPITAAATITLLSKVHVLCTGWETAPVTWTGGNGPAQVFSGNAITDWSVRGCRIVGPNVTLAGTADIRGIECDGCSRGIAENNKVTGMSYGIAELNSCGVDEHFNRNFVQTSTVQGIVTCGSHVSVESNRIDAVGTTALHHGIYNSGGIDVLDQGNQISNVQGFCIQAFEGTVGISIEEVRMIGNGCQLAGQAASGTRGGYFAGIASPATICRKITITGNTVENIAGDRGIGITDCVDVTIAGNPERTLNNSDCIAFSSTAGISKFSITPACDNSGLNGIDFFNTTSLISDGSITGGYIDTSVSDGINLGNAHDVTVSNVRIRNFNTNNSSNPGISSNGINNVLSGNIISNSVGTGDGIDVLGSASDNVVSGNKLFGVGGTPLSDSGTRTLKYCNKTNNTDAVCQFPLSISIGGGTALATTNQTGTGNLVLATSPTVTSPAFGTGVGQGSGFKHQRFGGVLGGTCPTAAAIGAACTSGNLNWTSGFADNNYTVVCTLNGSMTGQPHIVSTTYQAAGAGITLTIAADTAAAANVAAAGFVDCTATHD